MKDYRNLDRAIGEAFFALLFLPVSWALSMFYPIILGACVILFGKRIYDKDSRTHFHLPQYLCIPLTFVVVIGVGVATWFLAHITPFFDFQPILPFNIALAVSLFVAHLGDVFAAPKIELEKEIRGRLIDHEIFSEIQQAQNAVVLGLEARLKPSEPFRCANATADEIRAAGTRKKVLPEVIEFVIKAHTTRRFSKVLADEYHISEAAVNRRKQRWTKLIDD